jgi:alkylation response protein AidB-like acyl-CoA dehydrogenase
MGKEAVVVEDTEDMALLRDSSRGLLARLWPVEKAVPRSEQPDELRRLWKEAARQGWTSVGLDPEQKELSIGLLFMEELGRASCPIPLSDAILANQALRSVENPSPSVKRFLDGIATGDIVPTWIFGPESGEPGGSSLRILASNDGVTLNGKASFVENAQIATHLLVVAGRPSEIAILPVDAPGVGVTITPGLSRPALADVEFSSAAPDALIRSAFAAGGFLPRVARLLLAARALGAATRGLEILTAYAKERVQFGKKIGQFQAIQHKLANCLIGVDVTKLAVMRAGSQTGAPEEQGYALAVAAALAGQTLRNVVMEIHHGFGGISFWNEHEMPRHFRRVHSDLTRLGGVYGARSEIADFLFPPV